MDNNISYVKVSVNIAELKDYEADCLVYELAQSGYDMFEQDDKQLNAYISKTLYDEESLKAVVKIPFSVEFIEDRDWNKEWEQNYFKPIIIDDCCVVHSTFHTDVPKLKYDIVIDPKMSFGTGHHQTTRCMMKYILEDNFEGKRILDMGCGTGVLAILALMRGASSACGIDIDEHCIRNAAENARLNGVTLELRLGGAEQIGDSRFDVVFANINRNILLADMDKYAAALNAGGRLYISGFYESDISVLSEKAESLGLDLQAIITEEEWCAASFARVAR